MPQVEEGCTEYISKKKINRIGMLVLYVLFGLLLVNFLVFDHYYKRAQQNQQKVAAQEDMINKLEKLRETFKQKTQFLEKTGFLEQDKLSYYMDRIAALVPTELVLTDMQVNPLADPNKKQSFAFINNLIRISGISSRSMAFNDWIKQLKKNEAFKQVNIINYVQERQGNQAAFTIEITM